MVDISPLIPEGKKIIEAYGNGGFKVNAERIEGSIVIMPDAVFNWQISSFSAINIAALKDVIDNSKNIEILLLGCGKKIDFLPRDIEENLKQHKIKVEYLDSGSACRTYNVLLGEGRAIAAAIIAI
jgi:uncharacterized protein